MAIDVEYKINIENISKTFFSRRSVFKSLDNISLCVKENEFLVILGPGQCGKTVLLNVIAGIENPTTGEVKMAGIKKGQNKNYGFVFQKIALLPWKTVMENVELGPKLKGIGIKERREIAEHYIQLVGLSGFEDAYPHQLSGGMKQRVGIARAYAVDPDVLLMDEPFGQLDAQTRYQMQEEILRIWEIEKRTVIFVTSNIEEALYLGDRIALLSKCPATVRQIYTPSLPRPRNNMTEEFLQLRAEIADNTDLAL